MSEQQDQSQELDEKVEAPEVEESTEEAVEESSEEGGEEEALAAKAEEPAFTPNRKFKVLDNEYEIDEFLVPVIKDEDTQKRIKELYEKAYGLDAVKPKYQETRKKYEDLDGKYRKVQDIVGQMNQDVTRGDFDAFFEKMGIDQNKVYQWVADKVEYSQLEPEQRQILDQRRNAELKAVQAERELEQLRNQTEAQARQRVAQEFESALVEPETKTIADTYDALVGKPGAFRNLAADRGDLAWKLQGLHISGRQAVEEALSIIKPAVSKAMEAQAPQAQQQMVPAKQPKVIPNVSGKASSPVSEQVRSISDLKKLAQRHA